MRQLLILSGKGGTGKTTVAGALIRLSQAHAFADCDVDAPNLHLLMDRKDQPERADFYGMMKADIDLYKCSRCGTCLQHCRFHAIEVASDGAYYVNIPACEGCGVCQAVCPDGVISMRDTVAGELMLYRDGTVFFHRQAAHGQRQFGETGDRSEAAAPDGCCGPGFRGDRRVAWDRLSRYRVHERRPHGARRHGTLRVGHQ